MHIKIKNMCNASKHMNMHISNATNQSSWACSPYLCASLVQEFWSFSILQCCSLFVHVQLLLLPMMHLHIFVPTSPPLSSISIKRCASYWYKGWHWGRWLTFESCIFYGHHHMLEWHHLHSSWDTLYRMFDLDTNRWDTSPYVIAWVIHLIILSSCMWGNFSSLDDHLKLRITCGTTIWCARYHLYEYHL